MRNLVFILISIILFGCTETNKIENNDNYLDIKKLDRNQSIIEIFNNYNFEIKENTEQQKQIKFDSILTLSNNQEFNSTVNFNNYKLNVVGKVFSDFAVCRVNNTNYEFNNNCIGLFILCNDNSIYYLEKHIICDNFSCIIKFSNSSLKLEYALLMFGNLLSHCQFISNDQSYFVSTLKFEEIKKEEYLHQLTDLVFKNENIQHISQFSFNILDFLVSKSDIIYKYNPNTECDFGEVENIEVNQINTNNSVLKFDKCLDSHIYYSKNIKGFQYEKDENGNLQFPSKYR